MKRFDIKSDINQDTYMDEFSLIITEDTHSNIFKLDVDELLNLHQEVKHAVETNII